MADCNSCPSKGNCNSQSNCSIENNPNNKFGKIIGVMSGEGWSWKIYCNCFTC